MHPFSDPQKLHSHRPTFDGNGQSASLHGNTRIKVEQDIAFLSNRLAAMSAQPNPNPQLIEHYQTLLRSRESVLKWLMDGCDDETCGAAESSQRTS